MKASDRKKVEHIADEFMSTFPPFFRMVMQSGPATRRFDPSRMVLGAILAHGEIPMSAIGAHMGISRPYMTALVNKLIEKGYVERVEDSEDRRVINVTITRAGRQAFHEFMRGRREIMVKNLSVLTSEEISALEVSSITIKNITSSLERAAKDDEQEDRR